MILRVAWRTRSPYEWAAARAPRASARDHRRRDRGDRATAPTPSAWTPLEADLLAATDQLIDRYRIDDDTWARLAEQLDERQLVEVVFVVGTYTCLAMAFNSFGLELDPDLDASALPQSVRPTRCCVLTVVDSRRIERSSCVYDACA